MLLLPFYKVALELHWVYVLLFALPVAASLCLSSLGTEEQYKAETRL